jgi:hypothetical protein
MMNTLELVLTHRGVTLGTALAGPRNVFGATALAGEMDERDEVQLVFLPFEPGPGYSSIQSTCERAWQVLNNFGFLGPAADPASDVAGQAAYAAARSLWDEIELRDSRGRRIPGRVDVLYDMSQQRELNHWLDVTIDRKAAGVGAVIPWPPVHASTGETPAT